MVKAQLLIASGERLDEILPAEDRNPRPRHRVPHQRRASEKFTPSAGRITAFNVPGGNGVRVDTAQYAEGVVPPYYDSLIAKLIVHGRDRAEAIAKMERALSASSSSRASRPRSRCIRRSLPTPTFRAGRLRHQLHGEVPGSSKLKDGQPGRNGWILLQESSHFFSAEFL